MEINAEINKVFGEQMASLFAANISEEELKARSEEAWLLITKRPYRYGECEKSMLDKLLQEEIVKRVMIKVDEILKEPDTDEKIQEEALRIATEAKKKSEEMMINTIATNIHDRMFSNYSDSYLIARGCDQIAQAILNRR